MWLIFKQLKSKSRYLIELYGTETINEVMELLKKRFHLNTTDIILKQENSSKDIERDVPIKDLAFIDREIITFDYIAVQKPDDILDLKPKRFIAPRSQANREQLYQNPFLKKSNSSIDTKLNELANTENMP